MLAEADFSAAAAAASAAAAYDLSPRSRISPPLHYATLGAPTTTAAAVHPKAHAWPLNSHELGSLLAEAQTYNQHI